MAKDKDALTQFQLASLNVICHLDRYCQSENEVAFIRGRAVSMMLDTKFSSYHVKQLGELSQLGWLRRRQVGKIKAYEYALTERARAWFAGRLANACNHVVIEGQEMF